MTLFGKVTWGPLRPGICRIDHDHEGYDTHCFYQKATAARWKWTAAISISPGARCWRGWSMTAK